MAQGAMDGSRFLLNTTVGVAGLIDVANMIDLPKHNEDFGQTLGFWGVPTGNYLVVPFLGASSTREIVGVLGDALLNPLTYTFYRIITLYYNFIRWFVNIKANFYY